MAGFAFVNDQSISCGIKNHGHVANWRLERLHPELHASLSERGDRPIEIRRLQPAARAVRARRHPRRLPDAQRVAADLIFDPAAIVAIRRDHGRLQSQHAFVKRAGFRKVRRRVTSKSNFRKSHKLIGL